MMKTSFGWAPVLLLALASPTAAQELVLAAGSHCQPAEPAFAASLSYSDGAVTNTGSRPVRVTCPLPPVVPGYMMVGASVAKLDFNEQWGHRCLFRNLWPGTPPQSAMVTGLANSPWIGVAEIAVDSSVFVPHAVVCPLMPGQKLYGLTAQLEAL